MQHEQYILNRLPIGIVMLDRDSRVVSYSEHAETVLGSQRLMEKLGKTIVSTHAEQSHSKIEWLLQQSQQDGASGYASMLINVPDRVLQLRVSALRDGDGPSGFCLILYDLTDLTTEPAAPTDSEAERAKPRLLRKLPVSLDGRIALLDIADVALIRANGHYAEVCVDGRHCFCGLSLNQLESRLPKETFVRVHRSTLINLKHATAALRHDDQFLISIDGPCQHEVPVSRGNIALVRDLLGI